MFFNLTYLECFFLLRESLLEVLELFGAPEPPGNTCTCVAACCAAKAEFKRGLRVEVPKIKAKKHISVSICFIVYIYVVVVVVLFCILFCSYLLNFINIRTMRILILYFYVTIHVALTP